MARRTPGQTIAPRLLSLAQAGSMLGVTARTIDRYLKAGRLPAVRLPGGHRRVDVEDLDALIANGKEGSR